MILRQYVAPIVITSKGTKKDALREIMYYMLNSRAASGSGMLGNYYGDENGHAFVYNLEVAKRRKHRKNPTFHVYIYRISERWLLENGKKIVQHERHFTIENR